jgi:hypothetical protein
MELLEILEGSSKMNENDLEFNRRLVDFIRDNAHLMGDFDPDYPAVVNITVIHTDSDGRHKAYHRGIDPLTPPDGCNEADAMMAGGALSWASLHMTRKVAEVASKLMRKAYEREAYFEIGQKHATEEIREEIKRIEAREIVNG